MVPRRLTLPMTLLLTLPMLFFHHPSTTPLPSRQSGLDCDPRWSEKGKQKDESSVLLLHGAWLAETPLQKKSTYMHT